MINKIEILDLKRQYIKNNVQGGAIIIEFSFILKINRLEISVNNDQVFYI